MFVFGGSFGLLIIDLTAVGVTKMTEEMVSPQMAKQLVVVKKPGIAELTHRVTFVRSEKKYIHQMTFC